MGRPRYNLYDFCEIHWICGKKDRCPQSGSGSVGGFFCFRLRESFPCFLQEFRIESSQLFLEVIVVKDAHELPVVFSYLMNKRTGQVHETLVFCLRLCKKGVVSDAERV